MYKLLILLVFLISCNSPAEHSDFAKITSFSVQLDNAPEGLESIEGTLSHPQFGTINFQYQLDDENKVAIGVVNKLHYANDWLLTVKAFCNSHILTYKFDVTIGVVNVEVGEPIGVLLFHPTNIQ